MTNVRDFFSPPHPRAGPCVFYLSCKHTSCLFATKWKSSLIKVEKLHRKTESWIVVQLQQISTSLLIVAPPIPAAVA